MPTTILIALFLAAAPGAHALEFPLTRGQRAQKLVEEGQEQILRGNYFQAIESCTRALGVIKDWAPAYLCRGEARLRAKDPGAKNDAQQALHLDPKSGEPYRLLGILEFEAGRYPTAIQNFDEALQRAKLKPDAVPDVYYYRAKSRLSLGDPEAALEDAQHGLGVLQGVNGDYGDWSFYELRAEIYRQLGDENKAASEERRVIQLINQRLRRRPAEAPELLRRRAESNALLRQYDQAARDYGEVLNLSTGNAKVLLDRAMVFSKAGKSAAAIADLNRVLKLDPRQPEALRRRAQERFRTGDSRGAVADLNAYLALHPNDAEALVDRGIARRYLEDYRGALADFERAQMLHASDPAILWGHKAYVLEMLDKHAAALDAAEKALAADPENYYAHVARAQAGWSLNRCAQASPSLEWLVEKSPSSAQFRSMRGECRCSMGDDSGCLLDLEQAATLEPNSRYMAVTLALHHRIYLNRSRVAVSVRELRRSVQYFDRAESLGPLNSDQRMGRLLSVYELSGRLTAAKEAAERAGLLRRATAECRSILKEDRKNQAARSLCRAVRRETTSTQRPKSR